MSGKPTGDNKKLLISLNSEQPPARVTLSQQPVGRTPDTVQAKPPAKPAKGA